MRSRSFVLLAAVSALALGMVLQSVAQPSTFNRSRNPIHCGMLLLPSTANLGTNTDPYVTARNYDPYVFYNLGKRTDLVPSGWDFVNPFAPSVVTGRIKARWGLRVGDPIQKNMAAYWEVYLPELTDKMLGSYNVLVLHGGGTLALTPRDREKLRRFIDAGGVLWCDATSDQTSDGSNPLVLSFDFGGKGPAGVINPLHPLLNFPHKLTYSEAALLGTEAGAPRGLIASAYPADLLRFTPVTANSTGPVIADADFGSGHLVVTTPNIVSMLNEPAGGTNYNNAGRNSGPYGGTNFLNIPVSDLKFAYNVMGLVGTHKQFAKDARKTNSTFEDIHAPLFPKWAALGPQYSPQSDSSDHHGNTYHPPALFKGLVIVSTGTRILAFDADPSKDMDGDGNPDDGYPDYKLPGFGPAWTADLVWMWPPDGQNLPPSTFPLSSPLCVEIPAATSSTNKNVPLNQVWVMGADGTVFLLDAFPYNANAHQLLGASYAAATIPPPLVNTGDKIFISDINEDPRSTPNALTYSDGMIFASAGWLPDGVTGNPPYGGICWVISATAAAPVREDPAPLGWFVARNGRPQQSGANAPGQVKSFNTSPSVANVPMSDDGVGSDQVVYLGTSRFTNDKFNQNVSGGFAALWFRAHGERLTYQGLTSDGKQAIFGTRAAQQNLGIYDSGYPSNPADFRELDARVYSTSIDANGNEIPHSVAGFSVGGSTGQYKGKILVSMSDADARTYPVYADYTVDWVVPNDNVGNLDNLARTKIIFSDQNPPYSDVVKSLSVAPNGNVFVVTSERDVDSSRTAKPPYGAGSLYCFKERMGTVKLMYRWVLHNGYNQFMTQSSMDTTATPIPPAIVDADDLVTKMVPMLNQPLFKLHFHGSPTIYNNMVYVVASGRKKIFGFEVPVTIVLVFDADPQPAEIRLGGPITTDPGQITLQQPDITSETTDRQNPRQSWASLSNQNLSQMDVDLEQGIIHINNFLVPAGRAVMSVKAISTSQPVLLKMSSSQTPILINPNATGSHWSPLRWYFTMNGFGNQSPVMVTGETLYIAGSSVLGSFFGGIPGGPMLPQSVVFAWDSDVPTNDEFMINDPVTPNNTISNHQLMWLKTSPTFKGDTHLRWPSFEGLNASDAWQAQFMTRLKQATLSNAQSALGAVGGEGLLVAWDPTGLYAFDRALTLVTDQGRAVEVDAEGFADWSTQTTFNGIADNLGIDLKIAQIAAPTKAYKISSNEYLVVDTSANRVVRMDRAGFEMRSITGFTVAKMTASGGNSLLGFSPGDPLTLNQPRDALTWSEYILAKDNPFLDPAPAPIEYWTHYLIADTGNGRLVDIVDRQQSDPNFAVYGTIATGQLVYHSPLNAFGRRYRYDTVSRMATGLDKNQYPTFVIAASVSNWELGQNSLGSWGGNGPNLEAFSGLGNVIIERFDTTLSLADRLVAVQQGKYPLTGNVRKLVGAVSSQVFAAGWDTSDPAHPQAILGILIADQLGIIELKQAAPGDYKNWIVAWEMTNDDYLNLHRLLGDGVALKATGARRLSNGDILITNSFVGSTEGGKPFTGEVLEVHESAYNPGDPRHHGFINTSVAAQIPPLNGTSPLRTPLFADRQ